MKGVASLKVVPAFHRLLYSVLPISVANELRHSRPVPAKKYDCVTLLFSGIVGFGAYCAAHTDSSGAMKIVNMLNQLYTAFDVLTDPKKNPNVYKVSIYLHVTYTFVFGNIKYRVKNIYKSVIKILKDLPMKIFYI